MDFDLFNHEARARGLYLAQSQRLHKGESAMTYAMVTTAVHLYTDGRPVGEKVEKLWLGAVGDRGVFVMTDRCFDE